MEESSKNYNANLDIITAIENKIEANKGSTFMEILWDLGIAGTPEDCYEDSEDTLSRMNKKLAEKNYPKSYEECLEQIKKVCDEAIKSYDNEEFYEDDCDKFLGESNMAQNVMEIIDNYEEYTRMTAYIESQKVQAVDENRQV